MSWKVGIKTSSDKEWVFNGVRYATKEEATVAARDLEWRWTAVTAWTVEESTDAVTEQR